MKQRRRGRKRKVRALEKNVGTWIGPLFSGPIFGTGGDGARSCFTFFVKLRSLLEHFLSPKALYLKIGLWLRPLLKLLYIDWNPKLCTWSATRRATPSSITVSRKVLVANVRSSRTHETSRKDKSSSLMAF